MANANRNPNIPNLTTLELSDDECRLLKAIVARVGGVTDGPDRAAADRIFAALKGVDDSDVMAENVFGAIAVTDRNHYDLGDDKRIEHAQLHIGLEQAVYGLAERIGLVDEG